jgi:hypothetical protein
LRILRVRRAYDLSFAQLITLKIAPSSSKLAHMSQEI